MLTLLGGNRVCINGTSDAGAYVESRKFCVDQIDRLGGPVARTAVVSRDCDASWWRGRHLVQSVIAFHFFKGLRARRLHVVMNSSIG